MAFLMWYNDTVDGWNPAPVDMVHIPSFTGFCTSQVVQDFFHQQYESIIVWSLPSFCHCRLKKCLYAHRAVNMLIILRESLIHQAMIQVPVSPIHPFVRITQWYPTCSHDFTLIIPDCNWKNPREKRPPPHKMPEGQFRPRHSKVMFSIGRLGFP